MTPKKVWVFYPHDGGSPVLWTKPCPFPYEDEAECVEYFARAASPHRRTPMTEQDVEALAAKAEVYIIHIDGEDRNLGCVIRAQASEIERLRLSGDYDQEHRIT